MINNEASKQVAIAFAQWTIMNGMWQSDLTFEEQYECWMNELDENAFEDQGPEYDSAGFTEDDRIVNGQYRVVVG